MSWRDPARLEECAEDAALRDELRLLLGVAPATTPEPATESQIALAEDLRREALRRRHTPVMPLRRKTPFALLAAALPFALLVGGVGAWGVHQKRKADALAATMAEKEAELQRRMRNHEESQRREREVLAQQQPATEDTEKKPVSKGRAPKEFVVPSERQEIRPMQTQQVGDRR